MSHGILTLVKCAALVAVLILGANWVADEPRAFASPYEGTVQSASNTVYYVATTGNDSAPGTKKKPWRTIQKAARTALAGDTVYIRAGTYREKVRFDTHSGTAANPITFRNMPGETVTVSPLSDWTALYIRGQNYLIINGLSATGALQAGIVIQGGSHNLLRNCAAYGNGTQGIYITSNLTGEVTSQNTIESCDIHDNAWEGVYIKAFAAGTTVSYNLLADNSIHANGMEAVQNTGQNGGVPPDHTTIRHNKVYDNHGDWGTMSLMGDNVLVENNLFFKNSGGTIGSISVGYGRAIIVRNNVFYNNTGIDLVHDAAIRTMNSEIQILNNTIFGFKNYGVYIIDPIGSVVIKNNIFGKISNASIKLSSGNAALLAIDHNLFDGLKGLKGTNYLKGEAKFKNSSNIDFHLRSNSPAIDSATDVGLKHDLEGRVRPSGSGPDIGAYEY